VSLREDHLSPFECSTNALCKTDGLLRAPGDGIAVTTVRKTLEERIPRRPPSP
jgi:hypothetical protein